MTFHNFIGRRKGWKTLSDETAFSNPYLEVHAVKVQTPSRPEGCSWTVVHRKGAVVVAPMTRDGKFLLVRQERIPIREVIWEFPAGQIDEKTEGDEAAILRTARRELREETGHQLAAGGALTSLGYFFPSAGFTDEHSHLYLARPVVPSAAGSKPDEHEAIVECRAFSTAELRAMVARNEIRDANTLSAYARLCAMDLIEQR
ncbi:MAG: NUDIX hydrolase [Verrucomicrobiota bacterium]|nr:NUDIX hydrolase [Verrucomicrobiota bacterium]